MASAADLEVLAAAVLFGHRNTRLDVVNVFRVNDSQDPVTYRVNLPTHDEETIADAMDNVTAAPSAATDADLAIVFEAAVVKHRRFRLDLLNAIRDAQSKDAQEYYVNAYQPTPAELATALENVSN